MLIKGEMVARNCGRDYWARIREAKLRISSPIRSAFLPPAALANQRDHSPHGAVIGASGFASVGSLSSGAEACLLAGVLGVWAREHLGSQFAGQQVPAPQTAGGPPQCRDQPLGFRGKSSGNNFSR
jgi:hypothetical protein